MIFPFCINAQKTSLYKKNHNVNKILREVANFSDFKNASFGFYAIDTKTGEVIAQHNPDLSIKPASNMKLLSTATILELYGPNYCFETKLEYSGDIDTVSGILRGNIYITGGGDPTLGSKYFTQTAQKQFLKAWADAIQAKGIKTITGSIIADASIYSWDIVPPTWSWEDMANYFGAGPCGLSIYDNRYTLYYNTSATVGGSTTITRIEPKIPDLIVENRVTSASISDDQSYIFGPPYSNERFVKGRLPLNRTDYDVAGAMPDPAWYAAYELETELRNRNISIAKYATTKRMLVNENVYIEQKKHLIYTLYSPKLKEIIYQTNRKSINLFAEHCLNHSALKLGVQADTKVAAEALENYWATKGMDINGLSVNDGSGLSHYNVVTARQMVFLLNYMKNNSKFFNQYLNSLAIAGESGTMRRMCKGTRAQGNVKAKSGSIRRVRAYSGYVTSLSKREIAFSVLVNNFTCSSGESRRQLEKIMVALANFNL